MLPADMRSQVAYKINQGPSLYHLSTLQSKKNRIANEECGSVSSFAILLTPRQSKEDGIYKQLALLSSLAKLLIYNEEGFWRVKTGRKKSEKKIGINTKTKERYGTKSR